MRAKPNPNHTVAAMTKILKKRRNQNAHDGDAFIRASEQVSGAHEDLAEYLAEEYLRSAVSGENGDEESRDRVVEEELGGPFLEGRADEEFGRTRFVAETESEANAWPTAVGPLAIASPDEVLDEMVVDGEEGAIPGAVIDEEAEEAIELEAEPESRVELPLASFMPARAAPSLAATGRKA